VRESAQGGRDSAIARSIIALGRKFGLHVVAEGVETRSQADFLVRSGCITQQGYLYAKPMPAERFDELLRRDGSLVAGGCAIELPLG
jgi:EAL domain-containing protein (putative c-di-GMP-specific phosphodiesterase class I)